MPALGLLNYETHGDSKLPPILFLHGFLGSVNEWDEIINVLSDEFFCVAVDLPGHGESINVADENYSMQNCAATIVSILDELELAQTCLVGYSMGGRLALYIALNYPKKITKLILESASPGIKTEEERLARTTANNRLADKVLNVSLEEFVESWYKQPIFATLGSFPEKLNQLKKKRLKNNQEGLSKSLKYMGTGVQPSLWEKLVNLTTETLLIVGELDSKFQMIANGMCTINSTIKVKSVDDTGHNVHFEKPNVFAEMIKNFLK